jgi:hypothetical protein
MNVARLNGRSYRVQEYYYANVYGRILGVWEDWVP